MPSLCSTGSPQLVPSGSALFVFYRDSLACVLHGVHCLFLLWSYLLVIYRCLLARSSSIWRTWCACLNHKVHSVATTAFWRTFSHEGKISPGWWGWGRMPTPSHYIYHHQYSCSVRSSWVGRLTNPVSSLGKYILCGLNAQLVHFPIAQRIAQKKNANLGL